MLIAYTHGSQVCELGVGWPTGADVISIVLHLARDLDQAKVHPDLDICRDHQPDH